MHDSIALAYALGACAAWRLRIPHLTIALILLLLGVLSLNVPKKG